MTQLDVPYEKLMFWVYGLEAVYIALENNSQYELADQVRNIANSIDKAVGDADK